MLVDLSPTEMALIEEALDVLAECVRDVAEDGPVSPSDDLQAILAEARDAAERERSLRLLAERFRGYLDEGRER